MSDTATTAPEVPASGPDSGEPRAGGRAGRTPEQREQRFGWLLSAPAVVVMLAVTAWPMIDALWLSMHSYRLTDPAGREFVGLRNYGVVLSDSLWWRDVVTTVILTAVTVAVELVLGLAIAMALHRAVFLRRTVRTAVLVPYGIITVVAAFAWKYAFALDTGFVNQWFGLGDFNWFGERFSSLVVIGLAEVWKTTPFMALLLLAGLAQVDDSLLEAAQMDGASRWQRLWRVTLPNMRGALMVALLFRTLDCYRIFDTVFVSTAGANNTETVSFLAYRQMISRTALGLGSAVSVLLFASVALIAAVFIKGFKVDIGRVRGDQ